MNTSIGVHDGLERKPGLYGWFVIMLLGFSALTDLPVQIRVGPTSIANFAYAGFAFLFSLLILVRGKIPGRLIVFNLFLIVLLVWGLFSVVRGGVHARGLQNYFALVVFAVCIAFGGMVSFRSPGYVWYLIGKGIGLVDIVGMSIAIANIILFGWGSGVVGARWFVGPRSVGMFALLPLSWHVANWLVFRKKGELGRGLAWLVVVIISLSRTALLASFIVPLVGVLLAPRRTVVSRFIVGIGVLVLVGVLGAGMVSSGPLKDRFFMGDRGLVVGEFTLNTSGRVAVWKTVWQSALDSLLFGKGTGSSEVLVASVFPGLRHPHNDYLRILHDVGLIGLAAWISQLMLWARILVRTVSHYGQCGDNDSRRQAVALGAVLALSGISVVMLTDNPLTYSFVMAPFGLVLGSGLMARNGRGIQRLVAEG